MVHQPPAGARDLLPLDVSQKHWIESRLQQVFGGWGYQRIITPSLERLDTLAAGGAVDLASVVRVESEEDSGLGLRPELTASIARAAVTRLAGAALPLRLYYNANVFRRQTRADRVEISEGYQAGVELLGTRSVLADAEILQLLTASLGGLGLGSGGLNEGYLVLGQAGLTRMLLDPFPTDQRRAVRRAIAHLDRISLEQLPLSPDLRQRALALLDLRGEPTTVLNRLEALVDSDEARTASHDLRQLLTLLADLSLPLVLDLSFLQSFDYYTGITFEVVYRTASGPVVLAQGGRYDQLLALYDPQGRAWPGIGFSCDIEALQQVLRGSDRLPTQAPVSQQLVVATAPSEQARALTAVRRSPESTDSIRAELYLGADSDPERIRAFARTRGIGSILWLQPGQPETLEPLV